MDILWTFKNLLRSISLRLLFVCRRGKVYDTLILRKQFSRKPIERQGPSGDQTPVLGSSLRTFIQPWQAVGANAPVHSHDAAELWDGEEEHGGARPEGSPAPGAGPRTDRGLVDM